MGERRGRRRIGVVVGGNVDGLDGSHRTILGGGDALLQLPHFRGQRRLVAHGGGHAAEQRRNLGARLGETEDVVDEEEDVGAALVAEILRHGEGREADAQTCPGRFVHLPEDEHGAIDDTGFLHLQPQVVALAGALADAGEDGETAVHRSDVVDELLDDDGLADAGAAEQPGLAALHVRRQQVHHLDPGFEDLGLGLQLVEFRGLAVDRAALPHLHTALLVHRFAHQVEHATQSGLPHWHGDGSPHVHDGHAAAQAIGGAEGHGAHLAPAQVLLHLAPQRAALALALHLGLHGVVDRRQLRLGELRVQRRPDHLHDLASRHRLASPVLGLQAADAT